MLLKVWKTPLVTGSTKDQQVKSTLKATGKKTTQSTLTPTTVPNSQQQAQEPDSPQFPQTHSQHTQTDQQNPTNTGGQDQTSAEPQPALPPGMCALAISDVLSSNFDFAVYEYYADTQWNKVQPDDHVLCDRNLVDTGVWAMQSLMAMYIKVQKYV
jgi:hypothetical protein